MANPNKYMIRTAVVTGSRARYYFASLEAARKFCTAHDLPRSMIQKNKD